MFGETLKDISKLKDYRKKYKRYYGIEFGREYVIHHIDGNHDNNDISNLLLLPAKLHSRYHWCLNVFHSRESYDRMYEIRCTCHSYYHREMALRFWECHAECCKWYDYKMYLEGLMPNVHGIEL